MTRVFTKAIFTTLFIAATAFPQICEAASIARHSAGCRSHIASAEKKHGIPDRLLEAIATAESGVTPWVINYRNRAQFFHSKEAAAARIRELQKQGIRSINVGVMQLHAPSHLRRFKSIEDMLEPENNIAYAANLLKKLHRQHGSIEQAVKYYHSASARYNVRYKNKIYGIWNRLQGAKSAPLIQNVSLKSSPKKSKKVSRKHKIRAGFGPAAGLKKKASK